ncbi:MAG TPA: fluoride efflux transporter CrcB [Gaiellaceae bacterium]|jgi:CrcB protein|nr:fluoride efflux transporter CrcB [Gaiellaceae bacterium]
MPVVVGVALGGALGASARYSLDRFIEERSNAIFPWATFVINVSGCLLIGILTEQLVDRHHLPAWIRVGVIVGMIGGYTTFSTFSQEAFSLIESRDFGTVIVYAAGSVVTGILAVWAGTVLGRAL